MNVNTFSDDFIIINFNDAVFIRNYSNHFKWFEFKQICFLKISGQYLFINTYDNNIYIMDVNKYFYENIKDIVQIKPGMRVLDAIYVEKNKNHFILLSSDHNVYIIKDYIIHCIGKIAGESNRIFYTDSLFYFYDCKNRKLTLTDKYTFEVFKSIQHPVATLKTVDTTSGEMCLLHDDNQTIVDTGTNKRLRLLSMFKKSQFGPNGNLFVHSGTQLLCNGRVVCTSVNDFDINHDKLLVRYDNGFTIFTITT